MTGRGDDSVRAYPWDGFSEDVMGANGAALIMPSDIEDIIGAKQSVASGRKPR